MENPVHRLNPETHPIEDKVSIDNDLIVLVGFSNTNEDEQNIYHLDNNGNVIWRVWSSLKLEGGYFTKIWEENGTLLSSNYDGFIRRIDVATGEATPQKYIK